MYNLTHTQKRTLYVILTLSLISLLPILQYAQARSKLYWTEMDKIKRANLEGSNVEVILTELDTPRHIALDLLNCAFTECIGRI